jgi:hypothetical protein
VDFYVNTRIANVRFVQYVIAAGAIGIALIAVGEAPFLALVLGVIGAACVVAFELFYIRKYVTRLRRDASGWVMFTLSTFGERQVRFEPAQVQLGAEITQSVLDGGVNYHYPIYVAGQRFILDTTPPVQFDLEALQRVLRS